MNNKLFARIMTAVICICMMSTVVFAADPTLTVDGDTATLSFVIDGSDMSKNENEDQITMMAYLVDAAATEVPEYTNQKIVAINQVDGADGFGDVLIDATKLEEGKKVAVVLGGSDGTTESFFAAESTPAPTTYTVTYELNGGALAEDASNPATFTSENAATVLAALVAPAKADLVVDTETETTTTTYTFAGWFLDVNCTTAATAEAILAGDATAITLYAKYDEATTVVEKPQVSAVIVTLNGNGGLFGDAATLAVEVAANATFADVLASATYVEPVKTKTNVKGDKLDWAFVGWYTDAACETAVDLNATVSATNLYAKFVKVYIVGDANEDGNVNATDYAQIKLYYRSTATPKVNANFPAIGNLIPDNAYTVKKTDKSEVVYKVGDINGDGNVNATDYAQVKLYYRSTSSPKENANFVTIGKAVTIKKD